MGAARGEVMKKIMITTVGEKEEPILEGFRHHSGIDEVYFLCSKETLGIAENLRHTIERLYPEVKVIITDASRLDVILTDLKNNIRCRKGDTVISNITGGTKIMVLGLYIFTMAVGGKAFYIFKKEDDGMEYLEVPLLKLDLSQFAGFRGQRYRIAQILREGELTQHSISKKVNLKDTTVKAHLEKMERAGMITYRYDGKRKFVSLTDTGKTLLELYEIKRSIH